MKIIVDTNIIFSGLLNTNGAIGDLLFNSNDFFEFYSCNYMRYEIEKHWKKLKRFSRLSDRELQESRFRIFEIINFINEELIPQETWIEAETIVRDIDIDDSDFVALTNHLLGNLWTGDKELYKGLKERKFKGIYNTAELVAIRNKTKK